MERLHSFLEDSGILPYLNGRGEGAAPVYLVGGAVRDSIQGNVVTDLDFAMPVDPTECAKGLAHIFKGTWFMLDQSRNQSRVVMEIDGERIICDFAPFRAPTLDEDLRNRDFTINALAWPCGTPTISNHIIDPLNGRDDLEAGILRACNSQSFMEDPLRTLKGIRHATCLQMEIESETFSLLKEATPNIDQIAPERMRAELSRILAGADASTGIALLNSSGLLVEIFGQPSRLDGVSLAIDQIGFQEQLFADLRNSNSAALLAVLEREFEEYLPFSAVLKLAVFCMTYQPIALTNVLKALRFSNRTIDFVAGIQSSDLEDYLSELSVLPATDRGQARWVANLGREPIGVLCLMMAEMLSMQMDLAKVETLVDNYLRHLVDGRLPDLVDGNWLRTSYQITEGPMVGRLMKVIEEGELRGEMSTTQEARKWLYDNQKTIDNILLGNL